MFVSLRRCSILFLLWLSLSFFFFFFLNDPAPTEISPLPLPAALPISGRGRREPDRRCLLCADRPRRDRRAAMADALGGARSEEHTSELQSQSNLVCRLLLEKKKKI